MQKRRNAPFMPATRSNHSQKLPILVQNTVDFKKQMNLMGEDPKTPHLLSLEQITAGVRNYGRESPCKQQKTHFYT